MSKKKHHLEWMVNRVKEYLSGNGSINDIVAKYNISDRRVLRRWISEYTANKKLKDYVPKREVYMAEARRKTTLEERKEIVEYCINHGRDYKGADSKYDVSYSQVYSWVKKYDQNGDEALSDKRSHHKTEKEVDDLERLHRENLRLKRKLEDKDMLVELLKKSEGIRTVNTDKLIKYENVLLDVLRENGYSKTIVSSNNKVLDLLVLFLEIHTFLFFIYFMAIFFI